MKLIVVSTVALVAAPAMGFAPTVPLASSSSSALSMSSTGMTEEDFYVTPNPPTQKRKKMSESIPFLECPAVLRESDLAGNAGFDPMGFAKSKEQLWRFREAEIKHARLAMLAAVGWPVSELMDRSIADFFNSPAMLDEGDRVPSILNGGMGKVSPEWWGFCLGMCASIDMYGVAKARRGGPDYVPGNLGFDPLNFYPNDKEGQAGLQLAEIKHGRVAMLGVLGYVVEEYATKMAVVDDTPILFQPFTETMEEAIVSAISAEGVLEGALAGSL